MAYKHKWYDCRGSGPLRVIGLLLFWIFCGICFGCFKSCNFLVSFCLYVLCYGDSWSWFENQGKEARLLVHHFMYSCVCVCVLWNILTVLVCIIMFLSVINFILSLYIFLLTQNKILHLGFDYHHNIIINVSEFDSIHRLIAPPCSVNSSHWKKNFWEGTNFQLLGTLGFAFNSSLVIPTLLAELVLWPMPLQCWWTMSK